MSRLLRRRLSAVRGSVVSSPEAKGHDDERRAGSGEGGDAQVFKQAHEDSAASLPVGTVHEVGEGSFYDVHGLCLLSGLRRFATVPACQGVSASSEG